MKNILWLLLVLVFSASGFSQAQFKEGEKDNEVFTIVENMPEFPGGQEAMFQFLANNVVYPPEAKKNGIQGRVFVGFTVGKDGVIKDVHIVRGVHKLLDKEAMRVVRLMPKWKPGMQKGKAVAVSYNLPINFMFSKKGKKKKRKR